INRNESKKSHSWWWDSHISPKNSKWLQENLEEMDQLVKKILKVIEEDADSFAKKAELYFKKRPELVGLVEELYRMYRSLAERYDFVSGELRKTVPSDLQSQGSGISDAGSEPLPDHHPKPARTKSAPRAAGFGFFLGDFNSKEGDETSTLDSEAESDDSSMNCSGSQSNEEEQGLRKRVLELENELREIKGGKSHQEEMEAAKEEKIQLSREEITPRLTMIELQHDKSPVEDDDTPHSESVVVVAGNPPEIESLRKKIRDSEAEVEENSRSSDREKWQNQIRSAQGEVSALKNKLAREEREVKKLQDRILRYKTSLSERDHEIRALKEAMSDANKALSDDNDRLRAEITRATKDRAYLEHALKETDFRCQSSEEDLRRAKSDIAAKDDDLAKLRDDLESRDGEIEEMNERLRRLQIQHAELVAGLEEARKSAGELEREVERKREAIEERGEEKREAIRQLCFSLEHYRDGYRQLRQSIVAH
ncbi:hypothetical protein M569_15008, partial [Genlisea aurea]